MKLFPAPKRSLRANLVLGITAMLLPWVMFVLLEERLLPLRDIGANAYIVESSLDRSKL